MVALALTTHVSQSSVTKNINWKSKRLFIYLYVYFIFANNTRKCMSSKTGNTAKQGIVKTRNWYLQ